MTASRFNSTFRAHWFLLAAAVVLLSDFTLASIDSWSDPVLLEAGILFDLSVVIPALYLWCYRSRGKAAVLRAVGLSCVGIWLSGHLVPSEHHQILSSVGFVRYIGLGILLVIELKLAVMIFRAAFRRDQQAAPAVLTAARDAGVPEWAARLMAWEAALWRRAWVSVRRMVGRG